MTRYINADNLPRHGNRGGVTYWRDIEKQPTADVRENVRGEWLDYWDNPIKFYFDGRYSAHCSVCGYHPEYEEEMRSANFCPNCGAQMRQVTGKLKNSEDSTLSTR